MGMEINCMGTIASVHNFLMLQNFKTFCASPSTQFCQQQKLKNLFKVVLSDGSIDTRVLVLFQIYNLPLYVEALAEMSAWPDRETSSRALQLLSTITQSEFCIALLVLKYVFGYSVVLCKVKQKKSINLLKAVNIAQDIANELKCLREKTEYEFLQLYIFA